MIAVTDVDQTCRYGAWATGDTVEVIIFLVLITFPLAF